MVPHLDTVSTIRSMEHELALRRIEQRARVAAPRITFLPLACLLALATGAVLLGLAVTLSSSSARPVAASASPAEAVAAVRAFYAAANDVLRTGNPAPLDAVVGPDLVEHAARPGLPSGRSGLTHYLATLRAAYPTLRFEVDDLLVDNDQVSARVTATTDQGRSVLDRSADHAGIWRGVDLFRVEDGRVAERWSGSDAPSLVQPMARVPLDRWSSGSSMTAAAHLTLAPGAEVNRVAWPGPGLLVIESGELAVRGSGAAQVFQGSGEPVASQAVVPSGTERGLGSGDVMVFPAGTAVLSLRNDGTEPVVTLAVAWLPFQDGVVLAPGNEQEFSSR
ncbi:MAG: ester cyclase [Chloroflexota bacterium]|nr:ester cyclase [Chloroflexota bacterium]